MYKRPKYNAKKVEVDGIKFDSRLESRRYLELKELERHGNICLLELQVPFVLQEAYINGNGKKIRDIRYVADFTYYEIENSDVKEFMTVEDSKGFRRLPIYLAKKKLFEKVHYPLTIKETK